MKKSMQRTKTITLYALILALLFVVLTSCASPKEPLLSPTTTEDSIENSASNEAETTERRKFRDAEVTLGMTREVSYQFKKYTPADFPEINCIEVDDIMEETGDMVRRKLEALKDPGENPDKDLWVNENSYTQLLHLKLADSGDEYVLKACELLSQREDVAFAEPNWILHISEMLQSSAIPNDVYYPQQWATEKIQLPQAWNIITGSSSITVGVVDTGIDGTHPELAGRINSGLCRDFSGGTVESVTTPTDPIGHGTHVAGIIAAQTDNSTGISGVCWNIRVASLKVFDDNGNCAPNSLANAINFAAQQNIPILNLSLSSSSNFPLVESAIDDYTGLLVCAAGNSSSNNNFYSCYPANYDNSNLISVGSSTSIDQKASDSNYGNVTVDIFAPGVSILSTYPTQICVNQCDNEEPNPLHYAGGYHYMSGTSMAAPYVTGVAALLLAQDSSLTAIEIKQIIMDNTDTVYDASGNNVFGNLCVSGGRLNAYKTLSSIATEHVHSYTSSYVAYASYHHAYCACGVYTQESHNYITSGNIAYCTECNYEMELWRSAA